MTVRRVLLLLWFAPVLIAEERPAFDPSPADQEFLGDLEYRSFRYFWEQSGITGIIRDRAPADGSLKNQTHANIGSVAATGFGLTALCIAVERNYLPRQKAGLRVEQTLDFLANKAPREHGWFYHYMDPDTGARVWNSEISSIDTALLMAGVLTAGSYFADDPNISSLAKRIYEEIDFPWMLDGHRYLLRHGWTPERGFLPYRWDSYSELMILYILGIASPTHPIPPEAWYAWQRPVMEYSGYSFVTGGPLFVHQYSHAWFDFRELRERPPKAVDWFANSVAATAAQREFCYKLALVFPSYAADMWGITASDSAMGYTVWGEPPRTARIDGTIVPSAAGGSLMFTPDITLRALRKMYQHLGTTVYKRYGFVDAFNPHDEWVGPDVVGIDVGIILLSAENLRSGFVWKQFMSTEVAQSAITRIGLERVVPKKPAWYRRMFQWWPKQLRLEL